MNEPPTQPPTDLEALDDPALLAEIEAEFAELTAEIERISMMPSSMNVEKRQLIDALRESWRNRLAAAPADRPEWRKRLDDTLSHAVDRILEEGIQQTPDGNLAFNLRGETLQTEGAPVLRGLLDGLVHILEEKFPPPEKAPPPAPDAPPPNPLQALIGSFGQVLTGALKKAMQSPTTSSPADGTTIKVDVKSPETSDRGVEAVAHIQATGQQNISASFEIDTRKGPDGKAPEPSAAATGAAAASGLFFQQLIEGFGKAVKQAFVSPQQRETRAARDEAATPKEETVAPAAPNPLANIGKALAEAFQTMASKGPLVLKAAAPGADDAAADDAKKKKTTPDAEAPEPPEPQEAAAPATEAPSAPEASAPKPEASSPQDTPTPSLQIDFAGLFAQLLGGKKPPDK